MRGREAPGRRPGEPGGRGAAGGRRKQGPWARGGANLPATGGGRVCGEARPCRRPG